MGVVECNMMSSQILNADKVEGKDRQGCNKYRKKEDLTRKSKAKGLYRQLYLQWLMHVEYHSSNIRFGHSKHQ